LTSSCCNSKWHRVQAQLCPRSCTAPVVPELLVQLSDGRPVGPCMRRANGRRGSLACVARRQAWLDCECGSIAGVTRPLPVHARPCSPLLGFARSCLALSGPARYCSALLASARPCSVRPSCSARYGSARFYSALLGSTRFSFALRGSARSCSALLGPARSCSYNVAPTCGSRSVTRPGPCLAGPVALALARHNPYCRLKIWLLRGRGCRTLGLPLSSTPQPTRRRVFRYQGCSPNPEFVQSPCGRPSFACG